MTIAQTSRMVTRLCIANARSYGKKSGGELGFDIYELLKELTSQKSSRRNNSECSIKVDCRAERWKKYLRNLQRRIYNINGSRYIEKIENKTIRELKH